MASLARQELKLNPVQTNNIVARLRAPCVQTTAQANLIAVKVHFWTNPIRRLYPIQTVSKP